MKVKRHVRDAKDVWEGSLSDEHQGVEGTQSHVSNALVGPAKQCGHHLSEGSLQSCSDTVIWTNAHGRVHCLC